MPIYEFGCKTCRHEFKKLTRGSETPDSIHCPQCGDGRVMRLLSVTARSQMEDSNGGASCAMPAMGGGCCMGSMGACGCRE